MSSSITPQVEVIEPQVQPGTSAAETAGSQIVAPIPSGDNGPAIEAQDSEAFENDSAFGEDSYMPTIHQIVLKIMDLNKYENGRRYHSFRAGQYVMPNDEKEQDRLDLSYHVFRMILGGKLFYAPIGDNPQRVLDIGTGTGIWAIDFADQYPSAEVTGIDLSAIQPRWVPPNLRFQIDDAESEWTFPLNEPFDFIRLRSMGGSIADWPRLFKQAYKHLTPGGWIEVIEAEAWASTDDNSLPDTSSYSELQKRLDEASTKFGRTMNIAPYHKQALTNAGFEDVVDEVQKVPLSPWAKDEKLNKVGRYMQVQMLDAVESYGLALLTRVLGWDMVRTQVLIAGARQDLKNPAYHIYSNIHCVYGQKPKPGPEP